MIRPFNYQAPNMSSAGNPGNPPGLGSMAGIKPRPLRRVAPRKVRVRR